MTICLPSGIGENNKFKYIEELFSILYMGPSPIAGMTSHTNDIAKILF